MIIENNDLNDDTNDFNTNLNNSEEELNFNVNNLENFIRWVKDVETDERIFSCDYNENNKTVAILNSNNELKFFKIESDVIRDETTISSTDSIDMIQWVGEDEVIYSFNKKNLRLYSQQSHHNQVIFKRSVDISSLSQYNTDICVGMSNGELNFIDKRTYEIKTIHESKHMFNPITQMEIHGNYMYTATYPGYLYCWDCRNFKKCINVIKTDELPCSLKVIKENLYLLAESCLIKYSANLSIKELIWRDANIGVTGNEILLYFSENQSIIWNKINKIYRFAEKKNHIFLNKTVCELTGDFPTYSYKPDDNNNQTIQVMRINEVVKIQKLKNDQIVAIKSNGNILFGELIELS